MQIRLTGEQPFQVLSTTFTIGPSADGYDLMFSADGVNYSKLFTVGANTNRQVTQVAAGSYYYLAGNTGNVVVNWFGNCVVDNGGGGSYVLPVASQDTLGGIKVGQNLSIDANGVLSAQGGGSSDAYVLNAVTELPESANTGDVVALYQEAHSSLPSGVTYEGRSDFGPNQDRTGVRYVIPSDISLSGPENPLFLGNVSTDDNYYYFGMYAFNDSEYGVTFALSSDGDMENAWCAWYEGTEIQADFECYVNYYESGNSRVYEVYTLYVPIAFYNLPSNVPEVIGVYQYDGSDWVPAGITPATDEDLGGIIVGDGLSVDQNGVLSVPTASENNLGIVKVGSGLTINSGGTLSLASDAEAAVLKGRTNYPSVVPQLLADFGKVISKKTRCGDYVQFRTDRVDYESDDAVFSLESGNFWVEVSTENSSYFRIDCGDNDNYDTFRLGDDPEITQNFALTGNYLFTAWFESTYFKLSVQDSNTGNVIRIKNDWITQSQSAAGVNIGGTTSYEFEGLQVYKGQDGWQPVGSDYMVVSGLPQTAQDGQLFYVPEHIENVQYYGLTLTTQETENFIGHLYDAGNNEKSAVYISGTDFHWGWENDGEIHQKEDFYYKTDNQNKTFIFYVPDGWYITADNDTTTGETEGFSVQVTIAPATYRYIGDAFRKEVIKIKINDFKGADYGFNSNSLYDYLQQFTEDELKQNFVFEHDGNYAKYEAFYENERYDFSVNASPVVFPVGPPVAVPSYNVYANYDGSVSDDGRRATNIRLPIVVSVNLSSSGLTSNIGGIWVRICGDGEWGGNPVVAQIVDNNGGNKIVGYTQNCWFRQAYDGDNSDWADMSMDNAKIFGCEWYQYGDKITAEWVLDINGVAGGAPINWNVTSNVHSAADSTIPTNS